ncbi:MAG: hypothetical protein ACR2PH_05460, partial [Desulfobulbia bacterium]
TEAEIDELNDRLDARKQKGVGDWTPQLKQKPKRAMSRWRIGGQMGKPPLPGRRSDHKPAFNPKTGKPTEVYADDVLRGDPEAFERDAYDSWRGWVGQDSNVPGAHMKPHGVPYEVQTTTGEKRPKGTGSQVGDILQSMQGTHMPSKLGGPSETFWLGEWRIGGKGGAHYGGPNRYGARKEQMSYRQHKERDQLGEFMKFGALPPGFEHIEGNRGILGMPAAVRASGAQPFGGGGGGRSGGSGGGYRSVSNPNYKIGNSPRMPGNEVHAAEPQWQKGKAGAIDRTRFMEELRDPALRKRLYTLVEAEAGGMDGTGDAPSAKARKAVMETMFNRADVQGVGLRQIISSKAYYQPYSDGGFVRAARRMNAEKESEYAAILGEVQAGSNITHGATHNGSESVARSVRRGGYDSIRSSIMEFGGKDKETVYRKDYEKHHRIKYLEEDKEAPRQTSAPAEDMPEGEGIITKGPSAGEKKSFNFNDAPIDGLKSTEG